MRTTIYQRRAIVNKAHKNLSIKTQCSLLSIYRSGFYYRPAQESALNLELMRLIDVKYHKQPFRGVPSMTKWLKLDKGYHVNEKRIARLYRLMDIHALVPGPHTSKSNKEHKKYPYLLRNLKIERSNQVWGIDITFLPVKKGFMYLVAIIDLYSRCVVGWSLSNTMEAEWCKETLEEAIKLHGKPEIVNSDQGSQFTSDVFTLCLIKNDIKISMDGKGRATDNIFIERLWRSLKYEDIYLNCYETGSELFNGLKKYFDFYNHQRRHSSINDNFPAKYYKNVA